MLYATFGIKVLNREMWQNVIKQLAESFLNSFSVADKYILTISKIATK